MKVDVIVAGTETAEILLTSQGFYARCAQGCPWASEISHGKHLARQAGAEHDEKHATPRPDAARVAEVAGQLARFDHYPPEVNGREGWCLLCGGRVPEGTGLICLGHDNGGTFAAPLHKECGALVEAEHKRAAGARVQAG